MESFSKFASRFEKNLVRNNNEHSSLNSRTARSDMGYRDDTRRRTENGLVSLDQIKDIVTNSNENQLDVIQDFFDDERDDRISSEKEILRAIDLNAKAIARESRTLDEIQASLSEDSLDGYKELSALNKDEILKAVFSNADILKLLKEELIDNKKEEANEMIFDKATADKMFADLEDHVHKENVKCYRNVQAVVVEQDEKNLLNVKKNFGTVKILTIIGMVIAATNLGLIIAQILHII